MSAVDTTYFPENIVRDGVKGCCHHFAFAVHKRTGWPVGTLWRDPVIDAFTISTAPMLAHVYVVAPNGMAVDVEGAATIADLLARYDDKQGGKMRHETYGDVEDWARDVDKSACPIAVPGDRAVDAATKVIKDSEAFLELLNRLNAPAPGHGM